MPPRRQSQDKPRDALRHQGQDETAASKEAAPGQPRVSAPYRPPGRGTIRQLQHSLGNFAVARLVTSRIQRQGPLGGASHRPSLLGEESHLTLDPEIEAQMRAMEAMRGSLTPDALRPALLQIPADFVQPPGPMDAPALPAPDPLVPRGRGPAETKPASGGDALRAIMAIPAVDTAITNLQTRALGRVQRDWRNLGTGGQAAVVTSLAVIAGGSLAGAMTDPEARNFALGQLNGRVLPVPGVEGLGVELNTQGENVMVGLHLDIGRYLPEQLGFGPGSASAIGAPPMGRKVAEPETAVEEEGPEEP